MLHALSLAAAVLVVAIAVLLVYAATRPDEFRVERATRILAPADKIFALINDLHQWSAWSPWEKLDPAMQRSYGGSASGPGSTYAWDGNKKVGAGRMEIIESEAPARVAIKLDFIRPFEGHNIAEFALQSSGDATDVRWTMHGPSPFIARLMGIFLNMDRMIGRDFQAGLANMKAAAEN